MCILERTLGLQDSGIRIENYSTWFEIYELSSSYGTMFVVALRGRHFLHKIPHLTFFFRSFEQAEAMLLSK
jgi:hypothetical protein